MNDFLSIFNQRMILPDLYSLIQYTKNGCY